MYIFAFMRLRPWQRIALILGIIAPIFGATTSRDTLQHSSPWSASEKKLLRSLSLASETPLPSDPSNRYADDSVAARLGHRLFFDARFSRTGTVSCASCHIAEKNFQDGLRVGHGVGEGSRRTMPIAGTARSPWYFWDGRADSQWEQALGPLENPVEHGGDRTQYALLVATDYRGEYESVFGKLPSLRGLPAHAGPVAGIRQRRRVGTAFVRQTQRHHSRVREHRKGHRSVRASDRVRTNSLRSIRRRGARRCAPNAGNDLLGG